MWTTWSAFLGLWFHPASFSVLRTSVAVTKGVYDTVWNCLQSSFISLGRTNCKYSSRPFSSDCLFSLFDFKSSPPSEMFTHFQPGIAQTAVSLAGPLGRYLWTAMWQQWADPAAALGWMFGLQCFCRRCHVSIACNRDAGAHLWQFVHQTELRWGSQETLACTAFCKCASIEHGQKAALWRIPSTVCVCPGVAEGLQFTCSCEPERDTLPGRRTAKFLPCLLLGWWECSGLMIPPEPCQQEGLDMYLAFESRFTHLQNKFPLKEIDSETGNAKT